MLSIDTEKHSWKLMCEKEVIESVQPTLKHRKKKGLEAFHQSEVQGYLERHDSGYFYLVYTKRVLAFVIRKKHF